MSAYDLAYCGVVAAALLNPVETGEAAAYVIVWLAIEFLSLVF